MHKRRTHRFLLLLGATLALERAAFAQLENGGPNDNFTMSNWVSNITNPTDVAFLADGRAVIVLKGGEVIARRANGTLNRNAANLTVDTGHNEKGLLGVVALRSWRDTPNAAAEQRTIYLFASTGNTTANKHQVWRGVVQANDSVTIDGTGAPHTAWASRRARRASIRCTTTDAGRATA